MQKEALTDKEFDYEMWDSVQILMNVACVQWAVPMEVGDSAAQINSAADQRCTDSATGFSGMR